MHATELDRSQGLPQLVWRLLRSPVPPDRTILRSLGWVVLLLFAIQIVTGILLSLYYQPSPDVAAASVEFIMRDVQGGWLVRGIHSWASAGLLFVGLVQVLRVFLLGEYRGARRASWLVMLVLLVLGFSFAFTGELLTWDQQAYWTVRRACELVEGFPLLGGTFAVAVRGGEEVGAATLSRLHSVHVMLLPWLSFFLVLLNAWLLVKTRTEAVAGQGAATAPEVTP
jgi:quinol-cytochrome oxidoreductase complex cytochrome b subunit